MARLRRVLGRVAVVWLLGQVTTVTLAPALLWFGAGEELLECRCIHGDHAICPMHHKSSSTSSRCSMRSATGDSAGLVAAFGGIGPMPSASAALVAPAAHPRLFVPPDTSARPSRPSPPEPPPPRA